jgi:UDP-glucose 4-epimerase
LEWDSDVQWLEAPGEGTARDQGDREMTADTLSGRRALVTGGAGFIGSRLCRRLHALGADVYATSRAPETQAQGDVHWLAADLAELADVRAVFVAASPDVVFHLAGQVIGGRELELVHSTLRNNLIGTVNLLAAGQEECCPRIILAGSMEEPPPESPDSAPSSPYAVAKWAASGYARMFHALYSLPVVSLRIFMVYGPGQREPRLVPYVIRALLRGERPRLTSGTRAIDWVYVDDVVDAFLLAALAEGIEGAAVDVGSGTTVTIRDLVERIAVLVNPTIVPIFGALPDRALETSNVADLRRTEEILGWRPVTTLDDGLQATLEWLAGQPDIEHAGTSP